MEIKKLSDKLINLIAAGEVVERPASVIKELVENSLDAGAKSVEIHIENGGKNFISVSDDGFGIPKDKLELAFERHATSKIQNDIFDINFFGFRGEALPSIAAVAKIVVESKHAKQDAYQAIFEYGKLNDIRPSARVCGTKIVVQDLFATTPVRLKFLKSDRSEVMTCTNLIKKLALANYEVSFKFYSDNNLVLGYYGADSCDERMKDVLGQEFVQNSIRINFENERIKMNGRVGYPTLNKGTAHYIFNFVNNRTVKDRFLLQIIRNAYVNLMPNGKYPQAVMFFQFPNSEVDVNIHPTKQEIRLVDEYYFKTLIQTEIRKMLKSVSIQSNTAIEEALHQSFASSHPPTSFVRGSKRVGHDSRYSAPSGNTIKKVDELYEKASSYKNSLKEENEILRRAEARFGVGATAMIGSIDAQNAPLGYAKCQIGDSYIVAENGENLIIVDQHAAHERINLEEFKKKVSFSDAQILAVPIVVKVNSTQEVDHLITHSYLFEKYGISFERNGALEILIRKLNKLVKADDAYELIDVFVCDESVDAEGIEEKLVWILGNIACKKSIKAGQKLSLEEMNALLRQMEKTQHASSCNHGRPTYITLSKERLAKLFERG